MIRDTASILYMKCDTHLWQILNEPRRVRQPTRFSHVIELALTAAEQNVLRYWSLEIFQLILWNFVESTIKITKK